MSICVKYSKSRRMIVSGLCCDCSFDHRAITQDVYIGNGVLEGLPGMVKRRDMGNRLVIISDRNTHEAAGGDVARFMRQRDFDVRELILQPDVSCDETSVGRALLTMRMDTDFFLSVGGGAITDITRIVASQTERPMAVVATAPSAPSYTSVVSKASNDGFISSIRTVSPEIVVCDMNIIRKAPKQTVAAGFIEMMTKYLSVADWRIGRLINCEKVCPTYAQALLFCANQVLQSADEIASGSDAGLVKLTESLALSGLIVAQTGSNRPVESSEHAAADLYIMRLKKLGMKPGSYAMILLSALNNYLSVVDDIKALKDVSADADKIADTDFDAWITTGFGEDALRVKSLWPELTGQSVSRQAEAFVKRFASVKSALGDIPDSSVIREALKKIIPEQGDVDENIAREAFEYACVFNGSCSLAGISRFITKKA